MKFLRKHFLLVFALFFVYSIFFVTHLPSKKQTPHIQGAVNNLTLFEQPQNGREPILSAIDLAQQQIDVEVYLLSDKEIIQHLIDAHNRGVVVNVMLEQHPFGGGNVNTKTEKELKDAGVNVEWTSSDFALTHEKTIVIDKSVAFILNQNLTVSSFTKNREFDIITENPDDVLEIETIFVSDWKRESYVSSNPNLVVSPINARSVLTSLLNSAGQTIDIEMEVIEDRDIIQILKEKAKADVIRIIIPDFSEVAANKEEAVVLEQNGVDVKTMGSPYVHAKLVIIDDQKAYVGSVNFTTQSLDRNRELGIIIEQQNIIQTLTNDFANDWERATDFTN